MAVVVGNAGVVVRLVAILAFHQVLTLLSLDIEETVQASFLSILLSVLFVAIRHQKLLYFYLIILDCFVEIAVLDPHF